MHGGTSRARCHLSGLGYPAQQLLRLGFQTCPPELREAQSWVSNPNGTDVLEDMRPSGDICILPQGQSSVCCTPGGRTAPLGLGTLCWMDSLRLQERGHFTKVVSWQVGFFRLRAVAREGLPLSSTGSLDKEPLVCPQVQPSDFSAETGTALLSLPRAGQFLTGPRSSKSLEAKYLGLLTTEV